MYACIYCDPDFSCTRTYIQPEVVQEVLADLKKELSCLVMEYSLDSAEYDIFQNCLDNSIVPHNVHMIRLKEALKK